MQRTRSRRHPGRLLSAGIAALALTGLLTSCAADQSAQEDAELDTSNEQTDFDDWNRDFTACMADQGVDLPSGSGGDGVTMLDPGEVDMDELLSAQQTCYDQVGEPPASPDDPGVEEQNEAELAFAKCMRDAGYDFPDPGSSGSGTTTTTLEGEVDPQDIMTCREAAGLGGGPAS
ncbi:MAG: hypothetical protein BGO96_13610 [Micrococcales bacterium 73-15]|mgnify:CR=1 FL=1|uniref:hypothetical protein n=1 Tax=Salana multivorans TaxID=120377 RepID=UPI000968923D|nr:hypothetical protein [Salana multivorans]OJX97934.1 MAG: hypothetical protein BGO96_13610 [Micrococcales bacterium 73-15]